MNSIVENNSVASTLLAIFVATTPENLILNDAERNVVQYFGKNHATDEVDSPEYQMILTVLTDEGLYDGKGLTKAGERRALELLRKPQVKNVSYDEQFSQMGMKQQFAALRSLVTAIKATIGDKEKFEPTENVKELFENSADTLYGLIGIDMGEDEEVGV